MKKIAATKRVLPMWAGTGLMSAMLLGALVACKDHKPEPSCQETVTVTVRNGQRVIQAVNGVYLKEDFPTSGCESKPHSEDPKKRNFVARGYEHELFWKDGQLYDAPSYAALLKAGRWPQEENLIIRIYIGFSDNEGRKSREIAPPWWYEPRIPHKRYPIDLLPNFGLDAPDPNAGIGPVQSKPTAYWAVRGSMAPVTGRPYTSTCSMRPPTDRVDGDVSYQRDVKWLVHAETSTDRNIGNTCRGGVDANNGKRIAATVDVPGAALKDIDKIYAAVSKRLSEMTVD